MIFFDFQENKFVDANQYADYKSEIRIKLIRKLVQLLSLSIM